MGAIHGKNRFQCSKCHQGFSWRLDLTNHLQHCKKTIRRDAKPVSVYSNYYLVETCFLCGHHLSGVNSEEASYVKGYQKLYHSKRPLNKVLEMITKDASLHSLKQHTIGLCKNCMKAVNKWDEMDKQLQSMAQSICNSYRLKRKRKDEVKAVKMKVETDTQDSDWSPSQTEDDDDYDDDDETHHLKPRNVKTLRKQLDIKSLIEDDEKFQVCEDVKYSCDCGKTFKGLNVFVDHQLREGCKIKTKQYSCKFCGSVFNQRKFLILHRKDCTKSTLVDGAYECDICGRRFLVRGRVETHKRTVHNIGTIDQQLCSYCGKTFASSYNMKIHIAREHGVGDVETVMCEICGKTYSEKSSLLSHIKNTHGEKKYECETCGRKFASLGVRNHHINEVHKKLHSYDCRLCGKQFTVGARYRYHIRKVHEAPQYPCDACGKGFITPSDLYRHVRSVHMRLRDMKQYPCKSCDKIFPSKYKLKKHKSTHEVVVVQPEDKRDSENHEDCIGEFLKFPRGESSESSGLTNTTNGTTINIDELPVADVYAGPHITTLTPEILQAGVTPDIVPSNSMVVTSMSNLVMSASSLGANMTTKLHPSQDSQPSDNIQTHGSQQFSGGDSIVTETEAAASIIPVHQMIVIQESVEVPTHTAFTLPTSSSSSPSKVITVPNSSGQVISVPSGSAQVVSIPHSNSQVIPVTLHAPQTPLTVSLPQNNNPTDTTKGHNIPTIHYQYFPS